MKLLRKAAHRWLYVAGFGVALLVGGFFLLPHAHCCDKESPEIERLTGLAIAGDLDAIRALYQQARRDGTDASEEQWALEGALRGDKELQAAYVNLFATRFSEERRQRVVERVRAKAAMPGATCLLDSITQSQPPKVGCDRQSPGKSLQGTDAQPSPKRAN